MSYPKENDKIAQKAYSTLGGIKTIPIPVEKVVINNGLRLLSHDFEDDISGVLIIENGDATIGYNKNQHRVRNRFTIAHELGHYILHKNSKDLFVDKDVKVMFRSNHVDSLTQKHEREANLFAACILMPEELLQKEIDSLGLEDYSEEEAIKILAKKFDVSSVAMSYRISNLQLL